jgi:DNA-binding winged helix-turn-helix (wHTH) protein/tetratricopeptide (TPR) repeat protein
MHVASADPGGVVTFGVFELDRRNRQLRREGRPLRLQEQPFQVLALLLEHPGDLVSRGDIRSRLWPADTFVDFDNSLNAAVNRLREALGDSAENPRFIETVPRRGYRFIAPVAESAGASSRFGRVGPFPVAAGLAATACALALAAGMWSSRLRNAFPIGAASPSNVGSAASTVPPPKAEAFDAYLRARYHSDRLTALDTEEAIALLEKAVTVDPTFARGFAELSRAYRQKASYFSDDPERLQESAFVAAEKALALEPELADAHLARGFLLWSSYKHFDHRAAIQEYRRALELDSSLAEAHHQLGNVFLHVGLLEEAADELRRAVALNPANTLAQFHLAGAQEYLGQYEDALQGFARTEGFANRSLWTFEKASTLYRMGRLSEAAAVLAAHLSSHAEEDGGLVVSTNAVVLAAMGKTRESERDIAVAQAAKPKALVHHHHTAYNVAAAYALLGRPKEALLWMRKAAEDGFPCYPLFARDESFARLKDDPGVRQFLTNLRAEWHAYRRSVVSSQNIPPQNEQRRARPTAAERRPSSTSRSAGCGR